jgi:hypothetical protein
VALVVGVQRRTGLALAALVRLVGRLEEELL